MAFLGSGPGYALPGSVMASRALGNKLAGLLFGDIIDFIDEPPNDEIIRQAGRSVLLVSHMDCPLADATGL